MKLTPGMQQYMDIKNKHEDCIVLFRMGDFYETFFEDAKTCARELEITLTARGKDETKAPLAGLPYHALDPYLAKLVKKGYKVAIVEQIEDPKKAKGIVKRAVVRIVTPGTVFEPMILQEGHTNYLVSLAKASDEIGISACDVSTGEFITTQIKETQLVNELRRLNPAEVIIPMSLEESSFAKTLSESGFMISIFDDRHYYNATDTLKSFFQVLNLEAFNLPGNLSTQASGALLSYIKSNQVQSLSHINKIHSYTIDDFMHLDASTIRNLEVTSNLFGKDAQGSLLAVLDNTQTPMGKRLLRKWLTMPLKKKDQINERLNAVQDVFDKPIERDLLSKELESMYDIERLIGRVSFGNANPKDLVSLKLSFQIMPRIKEMCRTFESSLLSNITNLPDLSYSAQLITNAIKDEPNTTLREGNIIKSGYNKELDDLRAISSSGKSFLAQLEEREREKTGIKSLKIKYNRIFGYFIEVTKTNLDLVPEHYIRKQTQANSERYITEELKVMEGKILGAQERIVELEFNLFIEVIDKLKSEIDSVQVVAKHLGQLDCILCFAQIAQKKNYCRPELTEDTFEIIESRHPVIEAFSDISFIPNDCKLNKDHSMMIITGPNMAGKSTYMRQVALIALMSHAGSFVPATLAKIPLMDKIFTRIGAYDDLVSGQSTFMVEMSEAANILNNATSKSLVILDEIGRGTSTYDGLSLAWAITEYLHSKIKAKTLFATHYHHLNELASKYPAIGNYSIAIEEEEDKIVFLHKIVKGGTNKSYGIEVAKLAGVPKEVIDASILVMDSIQSSIGNINKEDRDLRDF